jgi:hypothetical protein
MNIVHVFWFSFVARAAQARGKTGNGHKDVDGVKIQAVWLPWAEL